MKRYRVLAVAALVTAIALPAAAQTDGASVYASKCLMCHAADGTGSTPAGRAIKAPSLLSPAAVKESNADLLVVINKGKGRMPGYAGRLTAAEITAVTAYIRTLQKQ